MGWQYETQGSALGFGTALEIAQDAALELGLSQSNAAVSINDTSNPFLSTDPAMILLCRLIKACGRELVDAHDWTHLQKEYAFTTVQAQSVYPLPTDFRDMTEQTGWNRTNRLPLGGPLSAQEWQFLASRLTGVVFTVLFRPMQGALVLYPNTNTPGGYAIAFEYRSSLWVMPQGTSPQTPVADDLMTANGSDIVFFDSLLMTKLLKKKWLEAKGFDSTIAANDYQRTLEACISNDTAAPILNLNRGGDIGDKLLDSSNIPITGFGS
jgi:hypothetical protein